MAVIKVPSAAASTSLLEQSSRTGFIIENSDPNRLHVLLAGSPASSTDKSFSLAQNESVEVRGYSGPVTGIWDADGAGYAHLSEL